MAEIDTSIYRQTPQDPLKQPLAILQLLGAVNQNKLQNMDIAGKQGIADVYSRNPFPAADELARAAGVHAPAAVGQQISNTTNQFGLDTAQTKYAQDTLAPLGAKKDLSDKDMSMWSANAVRNGVNPKTISGILDDVRGAKTPDEKRKAILNHGIMSMGTSGLEGTAGAPDEEGRITDVPKAQAIIERSAGSQPRVTTNPPGFEKRAGIGAEARGAAINRAANYGNEIFPLRQALYGMRKLGPGETGQGTDELNTIKNFITTNLPNLPGVNKIDVDKITDFDKTKKYLLQIAGPLSSSFGHGTDQSVSTALAASPNMKITNLAGQDLLQANIALRNMEHARALQADKEGISDAKYPGWAARWVTGVDPRAFIEDPTKEQLDFIGKSFKTKAEKDKFNRSYQMAIDSGIITPQEQK